MQKFIGTLPALLMLAACSSAPVHYYTLSIPRTQADLSTKQSATFLSIQPVGVPAQLDTSNLVLRDGKTGIQVLDDERWSSNFADEVRGALSQDLTEMLHTKDIAGLSAPGETMLRIKVQIRRFDILPNKAVTLNAVWQIDDAKNSSQNVCSTTSVVQTGNDTTALVQAAQVAVHELSRDIGQSIVSRTGHQFECSR